MVTSLSPTRHRLTDRHNLGGGLAVSPVCLGMISRDVVAPAFESGMNYFFISNDLHWRHYHPLMMGLRDLLRSGVSRDDIVVAGVSYLADPLFTTLQFHELIEEVPELERIDVIVSGATDAHNYPPRSRALMAAKRRKACGSRAIGASFHDRITARDAINSGLLDIAYVRYSPAHPAAEWEIFADLTSPRGTLVYNFKSTVGHVNRRRFAELGLQHEYWYPEITDRYRFALTPPQVDGVLLALDEPWHVRALSDALAKGPLDAEEMDFMKQLTLLDAGHVRLEAAS